MHWHASVTSHGTNHGVSIPELKMSTNLKLILYLFTIQSTKCRAEVELLQYTVVGTPCRPSSAEIEFRQSERLARGRVSEQQPSEVRAGPPLGAKASRSTIQKCIWNL